MNKKSSNLSGAGGLPKKPQGRLMIKI